MIYANPGNSGGAPHALAIAARLPDRVIRVSNTGAIAPLDLVGLDEWQPHFLTLGPVAPATAGPYPQLTRHHAGTHDAPSCGRPTLG